MMLVASYVLDRGGFGLFYAVVTAISVGVAPGLAITTVIGRRLASLNAAIGESSTASQACRIMRWALSRGMAVSAVLAAILMAVGPMFGIGSRISLILIPFAVEVFVLLEIERAAYQAMLAFRQASLLWLLSQGAQFCFVLAGLTLTGLVWTGVLGILGGAVVAGLVFFQPLQRLAGQSSDVGREMVRGRDLLVREWPFVVGYSLFVLFNNIDILLGYWLFTREGLDAYATSALLPKAIVTVTFPVAQILLPVLLDQRGEEMPVRASMVKAFGIVAIVGGVAAAGLIVLIPYFQGSAIGLRNLDFEIMAPLALGAVSLALLRLKIVADLAYGRWGAAMGQCLPILFLVAAGVTQIMDGHDFAWLYATISWGYFVVAMVAAGVQGRR